MTKDKAAASIIAGLLLLGACSQTSDPAIDRPRDDASSSPTASSPPVVQPSEAPGMPPGVELLSDEAVLSPAGGERYGNAGAVVIDDQGVFHMLRNSFTSFPGPSRTDHLVSDDGISWREVSKGPEFKGGQVPFGDAYTSAFIMTATVQDDGSWVGFFYTYSGQFSDGVIGRATAPGPEGPWTADDEPVLLPGPDGAWDEVRLAEPSVVRTRDGFALYFTGFDGDGVGRIGLATSQDGIAWRKHDDPATGGAFGDSDPVLEGRAEWDGAGIGDGQVFPVKGGLAMLYRAHPATGAKGIGLALSDDGVTWRASDANPLLTGDTAPNAPNAFWQSEVAALDGGTSALWWLEVGSSSTAIYAYRLGPELLA